MLTVVYVCITNKTFMLNVIMQNVVMLSVNYGRKKFCYIGSRGLYYKTFYDHNLQIFLIS
jgi:hypothetical protein